MAIDRCNGEFRGRINLQHRADADDIEIGWMFKRESWGQGLATEAVRAAIAWCFAGLDSRYVVALIKPANTSSRRVAGRLGMSLLRSETPHGEVEQVFGISRNSWRAAKQF